MNELVDGPVTVHVGDALSVLQELPSEPTPELYVEHMVEIFREVRRVLRSDGQLWLNLGDSYASGNRDWYDGSDRVNGSARGHHSRPLTLPSLKPKDLVGIPWRVVFALQADGWWLRSDIVWAKPNPMPESVTDRPTKAHEYLFLLTKSERYFYDADAVREALSPTTHPSGNGYAVQGDNHRLSRGGPGQSKGWMPPGAHGTRAADGNGMRMAEKWDNPNGRNLRSVWTIATQPTPDAHFATYPEDLVIPCLKAGTSEHGVCPQCGSPWVRVVERGESSWGARKDRGDDPRGYHVGDARSHQAGGESLRTVTSRKLDGGLGWVAARRDIGWQPTCAHNREPVPAIALDPFAGSGTTLAVARRLGRRAVGIELQADYLPLISKRIAAGALPLLELLQPEEVIG